jgi:hypothetical protein
VVLPNPNMLPPGAMPPIGPPPGPPPAPMGPPMGPPPMGGPPMGGPPLGPAMGAMSPMGPPPMGGMPMMPPQGIPGFPPGVMPDMNYPGSPAQKQAEMMMAMQDPSVMLALIRIMLADIDPDPGPKYPSWYRKEDYPRLNPAEIRGKAEQDRSDYQLLIERMRRDRDRIRMAVVGTFRDYEDDPDSQEVWRDASLALDVMLITSILSACEFLIQKHAKKSGEAAEAQQIENVDYAILDQAMSRHRQLRRSNFKADLVKTALSTGHLVTRILPNYYVDEGEVPIVWDTLDPASCFVQYDAYGICSVSRIYHQTVTEICHGFRVGKDARKRLMSKQQKVGTEYRDRRISDVVEAIEYWDRRQYCLQVDGEVIVQPVDHELGICPFVVSASSVGDAGNVYEQNLNAGWGLTANSKQVDLANKGQSHIQYLQIPHEQREAVMGIVATELQKIKNPPRTFEQDLVYYGDSPPRDNSPGGITLLHMGGEVEVPTPTDSRVQLLGPAMANITEAAQRGMLSPVDHGVMPGAQTSGAVVEGLSESSKDKFNLWKVMIQDHVEQCLDMSNVFMRDHGRKLGPEGKRGEPYTVERANPSYNEDGYFDFDYRVLHRNSCRVRVQMTSLRLQNLGPLGNAVQMWRNQGLMTKVEALELRGVQDPHAYLRQKDVEDFKDTPEYKTAKLLEWMEEEGDTRAIPTVMYLLATKGGSGGGGQPGASPAGPMPGNGAGPPPVGMPGAPGQQGGRPPQLPGPPPSLPGVPPGSPV